MTLCEQCIHEEVCNIRDCHDADDERALVQCSTFKNKADFVEVERGGWISLTECSNAGVYCSVCHKKVYKEDYAWCNKRNKLRSNYCPNCGADMRGGKEE